MACGASPGSLASGWFEDSLPEFLRRQDVQGRPAAVVHVDGDLYSSARTVLRELAGAGAIVPGTVLIFDELLHYPGWQNNEALALWEWLGKPDPEPGPEPESELWGRGAGKGDGAAGGGAAFDVRWVCAKDRVMPLEACRRAGAASNSNWKEMIAQGYDQAVAGVVTTRGGIGNGRERERERERESSAGEAQRCDRGAHSAPL